MKTKNNIQKTALTTVAATGLAILSLTVNAQGSMKPLFDNIEINQIAMTTEKTHNFFALNITTRSLNDAEVFATYLAEETEEPMNVENWMVEENNFVMLAELEAETESSLDIEDWMTNENTFSVNSFNLEVETEKSLQVEDWMMNENNFNAALLKAETEEEMVLEDWMINEDTFAITQDKSKVTKTSSTQISTSTFVYREVNIEEELEVEDWMINPKNWVK